MKTACAILFVLICAAPLYAQSKPADVQMKEPAALTELERTKLELHAVKVALANAQIEVAQLRAQLAQITLQAERAALQDGILKGRPGMEIDWQTLALKPVAPPAAPAPRK